MDAALSWIDTLVLPHVKYPSTALFFAGLAAAYLIYHVASFIHGREKRTRLQLAELRTSGVALRNEAQIQGVDINSWCAKSDAWNERTRSAIEKIDKADAEWFETLDTVPFPRVMFAANVAAFHHHDFRLVKLEQLLTRYGKSND